MPAPALHRFARAVRRRHIVARGCERIGLSLLAATALALLLLPVLWYYNTPALPLVLTLLSVGLTAGLIAACLNWPTALTAVMDADRQLKLADLLGTALSVTDPDSPWSATVLSLADARCQHLSANSVIVRRWGGRAWGGIAIALALTVGSGYLLNQPATLAAAAAHEQPLSVFTDTPDAPHRTTPRTLVTPTPRPLPRPAQSNPDSTDPTNPNDTAPSSDPAASTPSSTSPQPTAPGGDTNTGSGSAQTSAKPTPPPPATLAPSTATPAPAATAKIATGGHAGTGTTDTSPNGATPVGTNASAHAAPSPPPPWQATDSHPTDPVGQWQHRLDQHPELDAYRDVIHTYFTRD